MHFMKMSLGESRRNRLWWKIVAIVVVIFIAGLAAWFVLREAPAKDSAFVSPSVKQSEEPKPSDPSLTFAAMGDMLAHDSIVNQAKADSGYDFTAYFKDIKQLYEGSDVIFCNPETPSAGSSYGISGYPTFNAPTEFARDLNKVGCNMINLASNHMSDKGQEALNETISQWESLESILAVTGANRDIDEQNTVKYFEKNGLKVAFVALADFSNAQPPFSFSINFYHDKELLRQLLGEAREQADVVVVSAHWGTEDSHVVNGSQRAVAQEMADLGVDVIIGTGPHVIQPVEWLARADGGRTLVWFSIGNMLSSQLQIDELTGGVAKFKVTKQNDKVEISDISFDGTFMSYEWSAADRAASRLETRRNLQLKPLSESQAETGLFGVTVEERSQKLREWLGDEVVIKISP